MKSDNVYTIRYGIGTLLSNFLDSEYEKNMLEKVAKIKSDEYYVKMMIAWYFATALAKHYEDAILIIEEHKLDQWTHNKTIQKAVESRRISDTNKMTLRQYKVK